MQAKSTLSSPSRCWSVVFHSSRKKPNTRRASCRSSEVCLPILPVMSPGCETVVNMFFSLTFAILIVKDFLDLNFFLFCRSQVLSLVCVGFQETDMILRGNNACLTLLRRLCLGVPAGIPSQNKICRQALPSRRGKHSLRRLYMSGCRIPLHIALAKYQT